MKLNVTEYSFDGYRGTAKPTKPTSPPRVSAPKPPPSGRSRKGVPFVVLDVDGRRWEVEVEGGTRVSYAPRSIASTGR